jgi:hypothetical protein
MPPYIWFAEAKSVVEEGPGRSKGGTEIPRYRPEPIIALVATSESYRRGQMSRVRRDDLAALIRSCKVGDAVAGCPSKSAQQSRELKLQALQRSNRESSGLL